MEGRQLQLILQKESKVQQRSTNMGRTRSNKLFGDTDPASNFEFEKCCSWRGTNLTLVTNNSFCIQMTSSAATASGTRTKSCLVEVKQ